MEANENPRTKKSRFPDPAPATPMEKPPTVVSDHPPGLLSPLTPISPVSDQRFVLLFDWWLIKVENGSDAKGLAVGGLTTRGRFATRVFTSAPIVKRYDAYTVETADGITVGIQGIINRARMHHSGFPPEVCRRFLTGFPYNWDVDADKFCVKRPTAESIPRSIFVVQGLEKDPNSNSDTAFPIDINEFPLNRVLDVLNFCDSPVDDVMASDIANDQKYFTPHHTSMDPTTQNSPDMKNCSLSVMKTCSENVILSKFEREMRNHKQAVSEVNDPVAEHDVQHTAATHVEDIGHPINALVSDLLLEKSCSSLPETGSSFQRKILLGKAQELEPDNYQSSSIQANLNVYRMENVTDGNWYDRSAANMAGMAMEIEIGSGGLNVSHLKDEEVLKNSLLEKEDGAKETMVCSRNNSQSREAFDPKGEDFLHAKLCVAIETSLDADVTNSLEKPTVSDKKQKCVGKGSKKRLSDGEEKTSSFFSSDCAYINHTEEESRNSDILKPPDVISGSSNHTSLEEINYACLGVLGKINNCFVNPVMNRTALVGSVTDAERDLRSTKKKLNIEPKDNEMKKSVLEENIKKNVVRSVPVDQNVVSIENDEYRMRHVEEIARNRVRKSPGRIRNKEQDIQQDSQGPHSGPSASCEVQLGNGYISMDNTDKGKSFHFPVGCDAKPASQSGNAMEGHATKTNTEGKSKKDRKKGNHQTMRTCVTRDMANRSCFVSSENLNLRRSRSGRLLVPTLANWCQHLIYDVDGTITGIAGVDVLNSLSTGSKLEPKMKRKKSC